MSYMLDAVLDPERVAALQAEDAAQARRDFVRAGDMPSRIANLIAELGRRTAERDEAIKRAERAEHELKTLRCERWTPTPDMLPGAVYVQSGGERVRVPVEIGFTEHSDAFVYAMFVNGGWVDPGDLFIGQEDNFTLAQQALRGE